MKSTLLSVALAIAAPAAFAQLPAITTTPYDIIDLPDSHFPADINNQGEILIQSRLGIHILQNGRTRQVPIPVTGAQFFYPNGLNESGDIVGEYRDSGGFIVPFTIIQGRYETLAPVDGRTLIPQAINQQRLIVGATRKQGEYDRGFILAQGTPSFIQCDPMKHTVPLAVNRSGHIAGLCGTGAGSSGFIYKEGQFTFIDYPGAESTVLTSINTAGDVAGYAFLLDQDGYSYRIGFLLRNGVFHSLAFPGMRNDYIVGMNDIGQAVGSATILHHTPDGFGRFGYFSFVRNLRGIR